MTRLGKNVSRFLKIAIFKKFGHRDTFWLFRKHMFLDLEFFFEKLQRWQNRVTFYPKRVTNLPSYGLDFFFFLYLFQLKIFFIFFIFKSNKN